MPTQRTHVLLIASHVSLAGLLYGLDTGSIGPITTMTQFATSIGHLTATQQGIYVACILLSAAISSLASGYVSDRISRKWGIFTGSLLTLIGNVVSAASPNFASLIVARLITGAGAGQAIAVCTVYLVEIAPLESRGVVACLLQSYIVVGIAAGYFISYGSQRIGSSMSWRLLFIVQGFAATLLCLGMAFVPYSPRWLAQTGRSGEARRVLMRIREDEKVESELREIEESLVVEMSGPQASFTAAFARKYIRRTLLGIVLMALQQLTGIDAVLYYAPLLFQQAGFTTQRASFLASGVTGLVMIACTIPAQIWIDRWGRRKPLIIGGSAMAVCLLVIGSLYAKFGDVEDGKVVMKSKAGQWVVAVMIYVFTANFSWSWAVVCFFLAQRQTFILSVDFPRLPVNVLLALEQVGKIYACEIIPTPLRARVCAMEQLANWLVNFGVALTAPLFLRASPSGPYFLYAIATFCAVLLCTVIPETKGRSLEEIESLFEKR
ncbi:MAG: hypothetical protein Q9195_008866 [Heterodermia aff. obscurata]